MATPLRLWHSRKANLLASLLLTLGSLSLPLEKPAKATELEQPRVTTEDTTPLSVSGGRARGGGFSSPSAPPSSLPGGGLPRSLPGGGGYDGSYGGGYYEDYGGGYYPRGGYGRGPVVIPAPFPGGYGGGYGYPGGTTVIGGGFGSLIFLVMLGFVGLPMLFSLMRLGGSLVSSPSRSRGYGRSGYGGGYEAANELSNDVVTITQLQVALLAQARTIQTELTDMAARANVESKAGLSRLLQESVLALLRAPEYWSHARLNTQTVRGLEQATQIFEQFSIAERSKVSRETLVNVGGGVQRTAYTPRSNAGPAAYIVVTLLVGTADDRSLIDRPINSASDLQAALQRLGAISPEYLMIYELLWSPQDAGDSLSYDDLLLSYPNLTQIA